MPSTKPIKLASVVLSSLLATTLCAATVSAQPGLYWSDTFVSTISDSNLDGSARQTLVSGVKTSFGVAINQATGQICWTDLGKTQTLADRGDETIRCSNLDGSAQVTILRAADGLVHPVDLDIDALNGKIYWSDAGLQGRIYRANLDGSNVELVVNAVALRAPNYGNAAGQTLEFSQSWGIAVDAEAGTIYWTDYFGGDIHRVNTDGSNVVQLVSGLEVPRGIALDSAAGKMYWVDGFGDSVKRANLDGSAVEVLVNKNTGTRLRQPFDIEVDANAGLIYWTERDAGLIRQANLDGSNVVTVHTLTFLRRGKPRPLSPSGLAIIPADAVPTPPGPSAGSCQLNNGGCDPLTSCTDTAAGRLCGRCPAGYSGSGDTVCFPVVVTVSDLAAGISQIRAKAKKGNTQIEIQALVSNAGPGTINSAFTAKVFVSQNAVLDPLDQLFDTWNFGGLGSGSLMTLKSKGEVSGLASGEYVLLVVDADSVVNESDETNNLAAVQIP